MAVAAVNRGEPVSLYVGPGATAGSKFSSPSKLDRAALPKIRAKLGVHLSPGKVVAKLGNAVFWTIREAPAVTLNGGAIL